jgi:hypothetical protein
VQQEQQPRRSGILSINDAPVLPALPGHTPAQPAGSLPRPGVPPTPGEGAGTGTASP